MTGKMLQKLIEKRGDNYRLEMVVSGIDIELELIQRDESGAYIKPEDATFDRVNIMLYELGYIYQVVRRDEETMEKFLERVARQFNKVNKKFN